ncbi:uncharacterized protein METZ01_LOCUS64197 [marine metagenome]|uniref:Uncharacterized protein n=1 Tax=marine metagenome TaxID=408172 RepID=A0A381TBT4_9ZZZZ
MSVLQNLRITKSFVQWRPVNTSTWMSDRLGALDI